MRRVVVAIVLASLSPCFARAQLAERCDNDVDDDGDTLADCGDPDCAGHPSCPPGGGVESTPRACTNGVDDDGDGTIDCDDAGCRDLTICMGRRASEDTAARCANGADDDGDGRVDCADEGCASTARCGGREGPIADPPRLGEEGHRYPQRHVHQPLTLLGGMLAPAIGVSITNDLALGNAATRLGLGLSYGIFDFWEVSVLPLPLRVSPGAQYEDPAIATTLRVLDHELVELAVYANVAIPVATGAAGAEPLPLSHLLAQARSSGAAELDLALRSRVHLGDAARIDFAPSATLMFVSPSVQVGLTFPLAVSLQVTEYGYFGVESGVFLPGGAYDRPQVPLGLYAGATIPGSDRGPVVDARIRLAWPTFFDSARPGDEVRADGWQITLEARVLTYLLP